MLIGLVVAAFIAPRVVVAQQATVSINVIDYNGKVLPFEQFRADSNDHCAPNGAPLVHLHAINGPAVAIDLTEVPDPAPQGCGFGVLQGSGPTAATLRLANVTPAQVAAWSKKTSIEILSITAAVPADSLDPAKSAAATRQRLLLFAVIPLSLIAGLVVGLVMYSRAVRRHRLEAARYHLAPRAAWDEPEDGGLLRDRLARGHAELLDAAAAPAPTLAEPEVVDDEPPEVVDVEASKPGSEHPDDRTDDR